MKKVQTRKKYAYLEESKSLLERKSLKKLESLHDRISVLDESYKKIREVELSLSKEVAQFCLDLMDATPRGETSVHQTAHIITEFIWWKFKTPLDDAIRIAKQLELPEHEGDEDALLKQWDLMRGILEDYMAPEGSEPSTSAS